MPTPDIWNDPEYRARLQRYADPLMGGHRVRFDPRIITNSEIWAIEVYDASFVSEDFDCG